MKKTDPTVFVIEDDPAIADAIRWLLNTVGLNVELFSNGQTYLDIHDTTRRGCLVIDVRMPGMSGLELQERLVQRNNPIPIIIITGHGDIPMAVRAMQAGAFNFITKPFNDQTLLDEVQKAIAVSINQIEAPDPAESYHCYIQLTPREREVMKMVVNGKLNKQIAHELNIAISTVESHRAHVMEKMQANSLAQLVKIYLTLEEANFQH